ncbi:hypothetical protein HGA91_05855 [candidate division WWE3 bacterium]|nr:hypothetical protein [candidate division WWE3 bacterium]
MGGVYYIGFPFAHQAGYDIDVVDYIVAILSNSILYAIILGIIDMLKHKLAKK